MRALVAGSFVVASLVPVPATSDDGRLRELAAAAGQGAPLLRIGLEPAAEVRLESTRALRLIDPRDGSAVWRPEIEGPLRVFVEGVVRVAAPVYRVQVGAFATEDAATEELERLGRRLGTRGVVRHDPDRGSWRVRLGEAPDRVALAPLVERIRALGIAEAWVAEEPGGPAEGGRLRLLDAAFESFASGLERLVVLPAKGARLAVDGRAYRGVIELRVDASGGVRPINWIELEQYLLGVVPAELGPEVWPELQALQAQAVAARTYAWRNRGQFAEAGFDLCATPRCQVYGGADAEHPLSDRAVAATRGEILTWEGEPIVALYTATCGGHTEDGANVFPEQAAPYLRGVPCRAENDALASLRGVVRGRPVADARDSDGVDATRDWALLDVAGVLGAGTRRVEDAARPLDGATLREWTRHLARLAGLPAPAGPAPAVRTLGQAAATLLADLGWSERAEVLLSDQDLPALLRDPEAEALPVTERRALAYLAWSEALHPFADGGFRVAAAPSRARIAPALVRIGDAYDAFGLAEGVVSGVGRDSLRIVRGKGESRLALDERAALFAWSGGRTVAVERLELWPGDRVRFRTGEGGRIDFLELVPPVKGAADDRSAAVYSWEVRKSRRELEASINARLAIGRLTGLEVVRRGVSGRVVELRVEGTAGAAVARGFDVRRLLDIRDVLSVFEVTRAEDGSIDAVVFAGKGWGHGVGLCQVGAYGMALRDSGYREILAHYYRGATLERIPAGRTSPTPR